MLWLCSLKLNSWFCWNQINVSKQLYSFGNQIPFNLDTLQAILASFEHVRSNASLRSVI